MMIVDNFDEIKSFLGFYDENDFYVVSVIKRRKENPTMTVNATVLKEYHVFSYKEFEDIKNRLIGYCNINNARCYINLNRRNAEKLSLNVVLKTVELIKNGEYKAIKNAYSSVVGKSPVKKEYWIIDFDDVKKGDLSISEMCSYIDHELRPFENKKVFFTLPTISGVHLITRPFDLKGYKEKYPHVTVYKDAPTLIFA